MEVILREAAGNLKDAIGSVAGDVGMQLDGKSNELRGKAQQLCADATDRARLNVLTPACDAGRCSCNRFRDRRAAGIDPSAPLLCKD
ncbi:CsbD family protein [Paraburkholderia sp. HD33-4]|uniref:CsbD family protein n=1 Tax=Paraburkholderia sp. HD33-4 TaxID=2883242 RepID=UPI002DD44E25|nr:CsbD family protein [Paraburkholderia sp. HD33-4]